MGSGSSGPMELKRRRWRQQRRRQMRKVFAAALGLGAALLFGGTAEAQDKPKIRVGTQVSISAHLFMQNTLELLKGLSKTYDVDWVRFAGSGDVTPALVAGMAARCLETPFPPSNAIFQSKV